MSEKSNIAWTDATWNPWRGCTKVSPGCDNFYAEKLVTTRLGGEWGKGKPRVRAAEATFNAPLAWNKKPFIHSCGHASAFVNDPCPKCNMVGEWHTRRVFLGSLMDWLDPEVPIEWLADALDIVRRCDNLEWITVTKRPELFFEQWKGVERWSYEDAHNEPLTLWLHAWMSGNAPKNLTVLTSVENQKTADKRIPELLRMPAARRGLSIEPLLGPLALSRYIPISDLDGRCQKCGLDYNDECDAFGLHQCPPGFGPRLDWVIVGGESGPNARPCNLAWIRDIVEQCQLANVPVFVKQLGSNVHDRPRHEGNDRVVLLHHPKGGDPAEWPADLRVQQFPF